MLHRTNAANLIQHMEKFHMKDLQEFLLTAQKTQKQQQPPDEALQGMHVAGHRVHWDLFPPLPVSVLHCLPLFNIHWIHFYRVVTQFSKLSTNTPWIGGGIQFTRCLVLIPINHTVETWRDCCARIIQPSGFFYLFKALLFSFTYLICKPHVLRQVYSCLVSLYTHLYICSEVGIGTYVLDRNWNWNVHRCIMSKICSAI